MTEKQKKIEEAIQLLENGIENEPLTKGIHTVWLRRENYDKALALLRKEPCEMCKGREFIPGMLTDTPYPCPDCQSQEPAEAGEKVSEFVEETRRVIEKVQEDVAEINVDEKYSETQRSELLYTYLTAALNHQLSTCNRLGAETTKYELQREVNAILIQAKEDDENELLRTDCQEMKAMLEARRKDELYINHLKSHYKRSKEYAACYINMLMECLEFNESEKANLCVLAGAKTVRTKIKQLQAHLEVSEKRADKAEAKCVTCPAFIEKDKLQEEVKTLAAGIDSVNNACVKIRRELEAKLEAAENKVRLTDNVMGPHGMEPTDCPTFYDGCHCTVETLLYNIKRADTAEKALHLREEGAQGAH